MDITHSVSLPDQHVPFLRRTPYHILNNQTPAFMAPPQAGLVQGPALAGCLIWQDGRTQTEPGMLIWMPYRFHQYKTRNPCI